MARSRQTARKSTGRRSSFGMTLAAQSSEASSSDDSIRDEDIWQICDIRRNETLRKEAVLAQSSSIKAIVNRELDLKASKDKQMVASVQWLAGKDLTGCEAADFVRKVAKARESAQQLRSALTFVKEQSSFPTDEALLRTDFISTTTESILPSSITQDFADREKACVQTIVAAMQSAYPRFTVYFPAQWGLDPYEHDIYGMSLTKIMEDS